MQVYEYIYIYTVERLAHSLKLHQQRVHSIRILMRFIISTSHPSQYNLILLHKHNNLPSSPSPLMQFNSAFSGDADKTGETNRGEREEECREEINPSSGSRQWAFVSAGAKSMDVSISKPYPSKSLSSVAREHSEFCCRRTDIARVDKRGEIRPASTSARG